MTNRELAAALFNIATLLRDRQDNPYRIRAYERGARALMNRLSEDMVAPLRRADKPLPHPKGTLGERVQRKLQELAQTGEMTYFQELCADLPPHLEALMQVPGIGPRTAQRLYDTLGIENADQLWEAARRGRTREVWGVGPRREAQFAQMQFGQLSLFDEGHDERAPRRMAA